MLFFQGIGINSQGFTNFILFVWRTTKIREKLIMGCVHCLSLFCRYNKRDQPVISRERFYKTFNDEQILSVLMLCSCLNYIIYLSFSYISEFFSKNSQLWRMCSYWNFLKLFGKNVRFFLSLKWSMKLLFILVYVFSHIKIKKL